MKIAIVIGSRADAPGQIAIANALAERGAEVGIVPVSDLDISMFGDIPMFGSDFPEGLNAVVVLGDREEVALATVAYRGQNIKIAHIHAGEITGQEPDDTYRDVISRMATWLFVPHNPEWTTFQPYRTYNHVFNCGSPFITSVHNTELTEIIWPSGGPHIFVAFNPLPEKPEENAEIMKHLCIALKDQQSVHVIAPNTDRGNEDMRQAFGVYGVHENVSHADYLSFIATADVVVGNTSAGLIEGSYFGTPYVCVGSRQKYRVAGENVIKCEPSEMAEKIEEALAMGRKPNNAYGTKDSARLIAETLIDEVEKA